MENGQACRNLIRQKGIVGGNRLSEGPSEAYLFRFFVAFRCSIPPSMKQDSSGMRVFKGERRETVKFAYSGGLL